MASWDWCTDLRMWSRRTNISRSGSIIVDAAICLPFFIIAIALMLMLTAQIGIEENITREMTRCSLISIDAGAATDSSEDVTVIGNLAWRAAWEVSKRSGILWKQADTGFPRFYSELDMPLPGGVRIDGLVIARVGEDTALPSVKGFVSKASSVRTTVFRPFRGESEPASAEEKDPRVYVFPKLGARYHAEGCHVMQDGCAEAVLTRQLRKKYAACRICGPGVLPDGAKVYMFLETSGTFHRKECACITKSYVSMLRSQARAQGYTPCLICGGGE